MRQNSTSSYSLDKLNAGIRSHGARKASPTETTNDTQPKSNAIYSLMWMDFKNSFYSTQVSLADKFVLYWKDDFDRTYQNREDKSKGSRVQCAEIRLVMRTMIQLLGELPLQSQCRIRNLPILWIFEGTRASHRGLNA